jgi:hypothetical protein
MRLLEGSRSFDSRSINIQQTVFEIRVIRDRLDGKESQPNSPEAFEAVKELAFSGKLSCSGSDLKYAYNITDVNMIAEILEIAIRSDGVGDMFRSIILDKQYPFTDEHLSKFAKALVDQDRLDCARSLDKNGSLIHSFGITNQALLFEIIKFAAEKKGWYVLRNIQTFGITDENMLFEIVKIALACNKQAPVGGSLSDLIKASNALRYLTPEMLANIGITNSLMLSELEEMSNKIRHDFLYAGVNCLVSHLLALDTDVGLIQRAALSLQGIPSDSDLSRELLWVLNKLLTLRILIDSEPEEITNVTKRLQLHLEELKTVAQSLGVSPNEIWAGIGERKNLSRKQEDMLWLCAMLIHAANLPPEARVASPLFDASAALLLESIWQINDPIFRGKVTNVLLSIYSDPKERKILQNLMLEQKQPHLQLTLLFFVYAEISTEVIQGFIQELESGFYKDKKVRAPINEVIWALGESTIPPERKQELLKLLFQAPKQEDGEKRPAYQKRLQDYRQQQRQEIVALHTLLLFGQQQRLIDLNRKDTKTLIGIWQPFMREVFHLDAEELLKFAETFCHSGRYPNGLIVYASRLMTLPEEERQELLPLIGEFVRAILGGKFPERRYQLEGNAQLQTIAPLYPALLETWKVALPITSVHTGQEVQTEETPRQQMQKLMRRALENHHLGSDQESKYPELKEALKPGGLIAFEIGESDTKRVSRLCAFLLHPDTEETDLNGAIVTLLGLFSDPTHQFYRDLVDMRNRLKGPQRAPSTWIIEDTDAWEDFLLMGTEVDGSCQHIEADPALNGSVLVAALDGKIRLMIARNPSGKIVGRAVYRILWDQEKRQPVLFVETLYTKAGYENRALRGELLEGCKQKAQSMGIPLTATVRDYYDLCKDKYQGTLHALGGPCQFGEYVDALGGQQPGGQYAISESLLLYSPPVSELRVV